MTKISMQTNIEQYKGNDEMKKQMKYKWSVYIHAYGKSLFLKKSYSF